MAAIETITLGDRVIDLHKFTGEVVDEKMWVTTHVSGGGGGYNVGSGRNNPVSVTSSNVTHNQYFLKNENGQEMAVELADTGVAIRKGHRVTVIWGVIRGWQSGPFLAVHNHAMGAPVYIDSAIQNVAGPPPQWWRAFAWPFCVLAVCFYGIGILGIITLVITGSSRKARGREYSGALKAAVSKLAEAQS